MKPLTISLAMTIAVFSYAFADPITPNPRAAQYLHKNHPSAINATWSKTKEGMRARFEAGQSVIYEDYNRKGKWLSTITILPLNQIPAEVYSTVKYVFSQYEIRFGQHLKTIRGEVYIVKIKKDNNWKECKVFNNQLEVINEYNEPSVD